MKNVITIIILSVVCFSCYDFASRLEDLNRELSPQIDIDPRRGVPANGMDTVTITVSFPIEADRDLVRANFKAASGIFIESGTAEFEGTRPVREGDIVTITARLRSSTQAGIHNLDIEVPNVSRRITSIEFLTSAPATISASKNKFAVEQGFRDEIQLTAAMRASQGLPNQGTAVTFIVADTISSANSSLFRSLSGSNTSGVASVLFTPGDFGGYTGPVDYRVIATGEDGNELSATGTFEVIEEKED